VCWLRFKIRASAAKLTFTFSKVSSLGLKKHQNPWQVKMLLAICFEGILFDNFHDDIKVGIVMLFSFGIIRTM